MILVILLLIIFVLLCLLHQRRKKRAQVRLEKKITLKEKIQNFINKNYTYLFLFLGVILFIIFIIFILMFVPGTESGVWYNGGAESVV